MPIRSFNIPFPDTPKYIYSEIYVTCFATLSSVSRWQIAKNFVHFRVCVFTDLLKTCVMYPGNEEMERCFRILLMLCILINLAHGGKWNASTDITLRATFSKHRAFGGRSQKIDFFHILHINGYW